MNYSQNTTPPPPGHVSMLIIILTVCPLITLPLTGWYIFVENTTNHSSFDFMSLLSLYCMSALILILYSKRSILARIGVLLHICSILLLLYVDQSNSMVQYERWIKRGMPEKGEPAKEVFQWFIEK